MKKLITILLVLIILLNGCKEETKIINGTPAESSDAGNISELTEDLDEEGDNNAVQIDEVIVNISDTEDTGENESMDITDVLAEEGAEEEADLTGYWGKLTVSFIDIGCGDSIFVFTPKNGTMIIDGGDDVSGSKVLKILRDYGIYYFFDLMIGTNPDSRHIGGLDSILFNMMQVSEIYDNGQGSESQSYFQYHEMANNKGMFIGLDSDAEVNIDDDDSIKVDLIVPYKDGYSNNTEDNSIVVKMEYGGVSFLFMSACTTECEKKLEGYDLKANILKIGHYGRNSTSDEFLDSVDPEIAIISSDNRECGSIDPELLERLESRGIQVFRTDLDGTITVDSDGETYSIKTEKTRANETEEE